MGMVSELWAKYRGKQLHISATVTFAGLTLLLFGVLHVTFLTEFTGGEEMTAAAITLIVVGAILMFIAGPEFYRLNTEASIIKELTALTSEAELRRRKSEGDQAAVELGGGWEQRWDDFLKQKGLKRKR